MNIAFVALAASLLTAPPANTPVNTPANTAGKAGDAVAAFLPGQVKSVAPPRPMALPESGPLPDLTRPCAAVHRALGAALAGLTANRPDTCAAVLDTGYTQPDANHSQIGKGEIGREEIGREETLRRLREMLARNQCSEASFGLAGFRLETPDTAQVLVRERLTCLSRKTPPTRLTTADGHVALVNNTSTLTVTLLLSQRWVRRGAAWRLNRAQTLAAKMTAVL